MMRNLKVLNLYNAEIASTSVVNSNEVDLAPYIHVAGREMKAWLRVHGSTDTTTDALIDVKLQESATTASTDFSDITGATFTQVRPAAAAGAEEIHVQAAKRYVRAVITPDGTAATIKSGVVCDLLAMARGTT